MEDKYFTAYYIINNKILILSKHTDSALTFQEVGLDNLIDSNIDIIETIKDLKLNGEVMSAQNIIDYISNTFKDAVSYYDMSRKEYELIFFNNPKLQFLFLFKIHPR